MERERDDDDDDDDDDETSFNPIRPGRGGF